MNELELSYRRALRWYPSAWRARNGDAMVGTLLDIAETDGRTAPARFERVGLAVDGLLVRVDQVAPTSVRSGVSTVALATGLGFSLVYFVFHAWSPWAPGPTYFLHDTFTGFGPFVNPGALLCLGWVAGVALAIAGRQRSMRISMAVVIVLAIALFFIDHHPHGAWYGPSTLALVLFATLAIAATAGNPRFRKWLAIGSVLSVVAWSLDYIQVGAFSAALGGYYADERGYLVSAVIGLAALALLAVPIVAVILAIVKRPDVARVVMLSSLPWLALLVAYSVDFWRLGGGPGWAQQLGPVATGCLVWLIVFVMVGRIGRHRLRSRQPDDVAGA